MDIDYWIEVLSNHVKNQNICDIGIEMVDMGIIRYYRLITHFSNIINEIDDNNLGKKFIKITNGYSGLIMKWN